MWRSGTVPTGRDGVTGYAIGGEAGIRLENDLRLSITAAHYGRVDEPAAAFERTTVGMRLGWEIPSRR
jgi:1,4-dihydroxy-2-naphthoyl-CoA synthase